MSYPQILWIRSVIYDETSNGHRKFLPWLKNNQRQRRGEPVFWAYSWARVCAVQGEFSGMGQFTLGRSCVCGRKDLD